MIRDNPRNLHQELRHTLIQEPFTLLSGEAESARTQIRNNWKTSLGWVAILLTFSASLVLVFSAEAGQPYLWWLVGLVILVGIFYGVFYQSIWGPRTWVRNRIFPSLYRALAPLNPTKEELTVCMKNLKAMKVKLAGMVSAKDLFAELPQKNPS